MEDDRPPTARRTPWLPGATSLSKRLDETYPAERNVAPYSSASMRAWVVAHREANGDVFPHVASGEIPGANRTWMDVNNAPRNCQLAFTQSDSLSSWLDDMPSPPRVSPAEAIVSYHATAVRPDHLRTS
jgi:hypothetical protein